jgi:hypothetical protein
MRNSLILNEGNQKRKENRNIYDHKRLKCYINAHCEEKAKQRDFI